MRVKFISELSIHTFFPSFFVQNVVDLIVFLPQLGRDNDLEYVMYDQICGVQLARPGPNDSSFRLTQCAHAPLHVHIQQLDEV
jgi:hypothetical protein